MQDNVLRDALAAALAPRNDAERHVISYLARVASRQVPSLVEMIARAASRARAEGYDLGWHERGEHSQQR